MKKIKMLIFTLCSLLFIYNSTFTIFAKEANENVIIHLDGIEITTNYLRTDAYAERYETEDTISYMIFNRSSGERMAEFSSDKQSYSLTKNTSLRAFNHKIYLTHGGTTAIFGSEVILEIYTSGNFRQINRYHTGTLRAESSGPRVVEDPRQAVISSSGTFPSTSVKVLTTGVAAIVYGSAVSAGFSFDFLKAVGFNVSTTTSTNTYIRKYISADYTISLY